MIKINYALQTCDIASNVTNDRFCSESKTEVTLKCVTSFFDALLYAAEKNKDAFHTVFIFDDHSSETVKTFIQDIPSKYVADNIKIEIRHLQEKGIMNSIRKCYEWMTLEPCDLVYQVQDDYMFLESSVYEMIDVWHQIYNETNSEAIISPYNMHYLWDVCYRNRPTPRAVITGKHRYWIQYYDMSCSFMTSQNQFKKHWDLYEKFLSINPKHGVDGKLEAISLNYMLTKRGVLGITPISSLAFHMQSVKELDPYVDWKPIWDNINIGNYYNE